MKGYKFLDTQKVLAHMTTCHHFGFELLNKKFLGISRGIHVTMMQLINRLVHFEDMTTLRPLEHADGNDNIFPRGSGIH